MKTYLLGDHHSNHDQLLQALLRNGWRDARIIHVGDGEEGYPGKWDEETPERLNEGFAALGIEYLSIRGNHSNPHVFDGSILLPNFKLLPDYSRLEIDEESWLFVGGAVSIKGTTTTGPIINTKDAPSNSLGWRMWSSMSRAKPMTGRKADLNHPFIPDAIRAKSDTLLGETGMVASVCH